MKFSSLTDIGLVRNTNQDSSAVFPFNGNYLVMVCDGIGGANAGEVASFECINYFKNRIDKELNFKSLEDAKAFLLKEIQICNKYVLNIANRKAEFRGMGSTFTGFLFTKHGNLAFNVGDSRCYGITNGKLHQITKDHSLVNEMLDAGEITPAEAKHHPKRNYLTNAMGIWPTIRIDIYDVKDYDMYLACSDGLHGYCSEKEISEIFKENERLGVISKKLISLALLKGGHDNITVIVGKK